MLRIAAAATLAGLCAIAGAQEIVIAQTLPLTGPSAAIARDLQRGRQACTELVNAQGGIRGRPFRLVTRDDYGEASRAVGAARDLVESERAVALLGSMGPDVNSSVLAWASSAGMAVIGPYGGDIEVRNRDLGTAFFLTANQSAEAERLATHVAMLGLNRVIIVHASDRAGIAALTALEEGLAVLNVSAATVIAVRPDAADAPQVAKALAAANPQAVLMATTGRTTSGVLKALASAQGGSRRLLQVYGLSSAASQSELLDLGENARGFSMSQVLPLPRDARVPMVATFLTAMRDVPGERTYAELEGCIGPLLLAEVLRRKPTDLTRGGVLLALKGAGRVNLGGFEIDLGDRARPGARFTDIVFVGSDGRLLH